jgi:crotonobetainyl-CoA:carnitine CoA-transferase CaiB-like acyl-CoA transferase
MYGAYGVLAALLERERTGRGEVVRTSLLSSIVGVHAYQGTRWTLAGPVPTSIGNHHPSIAPYGLFDAANAPVQIACGSEGLWRAFAPLVDLDLADERFTTNSKRVQNREELNALINARLAEHDAEHWLPLFVEAGVPAGKVRTIDDVYRWDQTRSQGLVIEVDDPVVGPIELPGPPIRFGERPHAGGRDAHHSPPRLGEHNTPVREWLARCEGE